MRAGFPRMPPWPLYPKSVAHHTAAGRSGASLRFLKTEVRLDSSKVHHMASRINGSVNSSIKPGPVVPRLGILNDYVRIPYANGSSFASQFLYREFKRRGSQVTVVGPRDPKMNQADLPPDHVTFASLPLRNHPGVYLPMPNREALKSLVEAKLDLVVAQTGSALMNAGLWLRRNHGVPLVCVNTIHLPSVYDVLLPESLHNSQLSHDLFQKRIIPWVEQRSVDIYNGGDALVVLSEGLKTYWRDRGVTVPIEVIPRSVEPAIFDQHPENDPFPEWAAQGERLLCICRHTREKNVQRLIEIFAHEVLPARPGACLALVGDGPDHDYFKEYARKLGVFERCVFPGEVRLQDTPAWYRHADLFVYTSLSETYGQVVSEALWCGLPVIAFVDDKGVSDQVIHDSDGFLVEPTRPAADREFGSRVVQLLKDPAQRLLFSQRAESKARRRSDPAAGVAAYERVFGDAIENCRRSFRVGGVVQRTSPVVSWAAVHTLLAGLGCVRPPAVVNRHNRQQPDWDLRDVAKVSVPSRAKDARRLRLVG
jgi:1,2-diacylglycerol 3-alpha-glucosyltransferase